MACPTWLARVRGSDVVGLHEGGVEQIAQGGAIARLEARALSPGDLRGFGRDGGELSEIGVAGLAPVEHDHGGGDLGEAADGKLLVGMSLLENEAGGAIRRRQKAAASSCAGGNRERRSNVKSSATGANFNKAM